jgi:PleD family two-component response regulator
MDKLSVLIIDDDKDTAEFFRTVLSLIGLECEFVLSAKQALAILASSVPDLILLDMRLGLEISGEDILFQIRSNPRFDSTRVIVVTAYPQLAEPITDLADLVLLKPVAVDQLRELARRVLPNLPKTGQTAFRDPVTHLFNREFLIARLELAFERGKRKADFFYSLVIISARLSDEQLEQISPKLAIELQRKIAERARYNIRPTDTIARLSEWKFATLNEDLSKPEDFRIIIDRLRQKLGMPYDLGDQSYNIEFQFSGVANNAHFTTPTEILEEAERELAEAIASGG